MKMTDLLLLGLMGVAAWYFLKVPGNSSASTSNPVTSLGVQIYNDPSAIFARLQGAAGGGYEQLNNAQWQALYAQYSTSPAPSVSVDPTTRMTLYQWWPLAFPNSGLAGLGWAA